MRKKIIGLPRVYLYYKNNKLWRNFFNYLGCSVCVSPSTNEEIREIAIIFNKKVSNHILEQLHQELVEKE